MSTTLVVLAAGMGSRYGGLKQLDRFGPSRLTIMEYSIRDAIRVGFSKVVFVIRRDFEHEFKERIVDAYKDSAEIRLAFQENEVDGVTIQRKKPWGTGHAILSASSCVQEPFAVINADDFYGRQSFELAQNFLLNEANNRLYGMVAYILSNTLSPNGSVSRGLCSVDKNHFLSTVREHTNIRRVNHLIQGEIEGNVVDLLPQSLVSMNLWMFDPSVFESLGRRFLQFARDNVHIPDAEFYIPSFVDERLQSGEVKVKVIPTNEKWYGVTYREDRKRVNLALQALHEAGIY